MECPDVYVGGLKMYLFIINMKDAIGQKTHQSSRYPLFTSYPYDGIIANMHYSQRFKYSRSLTF